MHHSVEEMGFAAHLRYHWMENIVYRTLEYIPLALLGIGLYDFFIIHIYDCSMRKKVLEEFQCIYNRVFTMN